MARGGTGLDPRLRLSVAAGRATAAAIRRMGRGGGTTLPGRISERIDGRTSAKLARRLEGGSIVVSGTNGKTTTTSLVRTILEAAGFDVIGNQAGSNLSWGVTAALVAGGRGRGDAGPVGVFEVDEASLPGICGALQPRAVVVTNLFRDQLDRYGELDTSGAAVGAALAALPSTSTALLCADDPAVAALGVDLRARTLFYGLDLAGPGESVLPHAADAKFCPRCGEPFEFERVYVGHMGAYRCPNGDFTRPPRDLAATLVDFRGLESQKVGLTGMGMDGTVLDVPLSGLYNTYNILAAAGAAQLLNVGPAVIGEALAGFTPAFGRLETLDLQGRRVQVMLAKNPAGFNEVLRASRVLGGGHQFLVSVNDRLADGTDISWIWDVDFELLADAEHVVLSGDRALDMAVRLEYAGVDRSRVEVVEAQGPAIDAAVRACPAGEGLFILPTYTAMLDIRAELAGRGVVKQFWEKA